MSELRKIPLDVFYDGSFRQITGMNRSLGYIVSTLKSANGIEGPNSCILLFQFRNALLYKIHREKRLILHILLVSTKRLGVAKMRRQPSSTYMHSFTHTGTYLY